MYNKPCISKDYVASEMLHQNLLIKKIILCEVIIFCLLLYI